MRKDESEEMRPEYRREDLGKGVRGKYLESYRAGTNLVLLGPDVAKVFSTEQLVNEALRSLIEVAQKSVGPTKRSSRRGKPAKLSRQDIEARLQGQLPPLPAAEVEKLRRLGEKYKAGG